MRRVSFYAVLFLCFITAPVAYAAATVSIGAFLPANVNNVVGVGTRVSFSVTTSGIGSPIYRVVDSFPGGVNSSNIDSAGNFSWIPNRDDVGTHTVTVTASDIYGVETSSSVTITVVKPNVSVSQLSPGAVVRYGEQVSFNITSTGFAYPQYSVTDSVYSSGVGSFNISPSNVFYWTPLLKDIGTHVLTINCSDVQGHLATTSQTITVEGLPSVTVLGAPSDIGAGSLLTFTATTTGFTSPSMTVTDLFYADRTSTSTLKLNGTTASWTPVYNDIGVHTFIVSATDAVGHRASSTPLYVTVGPPGAAPVQPATVAVVPAPLTTYSSSNTTAVFKSFLTMGSRGAEVTALQQKLIALGLLSRQSTGYFGSLTKKAVQAFQKSKGIEPVGYVGPGTRAALNK